MERLSVGNSANYSAIEGSIHVGRYAPALPFCQGKRILDIACGEGYGSWLLSQAGAQSVLGVDVSAEAVTRAQRHFQTANLTFEVCDAEQVADQLTGQTFDVIVSIETIEHLQNPQSFLSQLRRLAAEDCLILISCPNDHWYYTDGQSNPFHIRKYTFPEFQDLATGELGNKVRWFAGTAAQGFVTAPIQPDGGPVTVYGQGAPSKYVAVEQMAMSILCPPAEADPIETATCSYFLGIWNPPPGLLSGGAVFPMSMTAYALREQAPALRDQLMASLDEGRTAKLAADTAKATAVTTIEALTLENQAEKAAQEKLERDVRNLRVQAASLRRENDVLAESIQRWRVRTADLEGVKARLESEKADLDNLRAHVESEKQGLQATNAALEHETARLREEVSRRAGQEAQLSNEVARLAAENTALQGALATWTRRKERLFRLVPHPLRPLASWTYRKLVPRRTLPPRGV